MSIVKTKKLLYTEKQIDYLISADPIFGHAVKKLGRVEREIIPDLFAALVYAIIGQLISVRSARAIWQRMQLEINITPQELSTKSVDEIRYYGLTARKSKVIQTISTDVINGHILLDDMRALPDEQFIQKITEIDGIGRWTAEMLLINCLERQNILSRSDIAIQRGIKKLYGLTQIDEANFDDCEKRFSPFCSVASIYLWEIAFL